MPHRVSPTERIRGHIDELFASGKQLPEILEDVARRGQAETSPSGSPLSSSCSILVEWLEIVTSLTLPG
jgi:hypothetical protein